MTDKLDKNVGSKLKSKLSAYQIPMINNDYADKKNFSSI